MKLLFVTLTFAATCVFAQTPAPSLAEIKIAADAGDPAAQDKLAEKFILRADTAQAEIWYRKAANQGDKRGQADFADICLEGKWVKQNLVEAYKWGELASQGSMLDVAIITGRSTCDAAILKMNADQIAEPVNVRRRSFRIKCRNPKCPNRPG